MTENDIKASLQSLSKNNDFLSIIKTLSQNYSLVFTMLTNNDIESVFLKLNECKEFENYINVMIFKEYLKSTGKDRVKKV